MPERRQHCRPTSLGGCQRLRTTASLQKSSTRCPCKICQERIRAGTSFCWERSKQTAKEHIWPSQLRLKASAFNGLDELDELLDGLRECARLGPLPPTPPTLRQLARRPQASRLPLPASEAQSAVVALVCLQQKHPRTGTTNGVVNVAYQSKPVEPIYF